MKKMMVFLLLRSDGGSDGRQDDGVSFVEKWCWRQRLGFRNVFWYSVSPHHLYLYLNLAEGGHRSYATGQRYGVYPHHLYRYYSANSSAGYAQQYGNLSCSRSSIATVKGGSRTKGIGQWLDENGFESREKGRGFFDSWVGTTSSEPIVPNHGFSARFRHRNA
ncbi:putative riboflavin synthase-like beta-barrel [Helianthus annuus]|nr:putative riboflavin synthase-like beta-barrel [Helianthus annuus]KAJ0583401.1 putative riboflavin synthase-like beta-barrel [Helianthus annuus]KAJ0746137.1 putative riboflavin synthase-like beta-barrel [Helianthus annuus]KAJ0749139.1 putative riboflavin synthase-like beta-barrel [Helianthus annuus]